MTDEIHLPRFFTDIHVPFAAIKELRRRGVDILRCLEAGFEHEEQDEVLLKYASENGRIMITCDIDFSGLHDRWQEEGLSHGGIILFNMAKGRCTDKGHVVMTIFDYYQAVLEGAGTYEADLYNHLIRE